MRHGKFELRGELENCLEEIKWFLDQYRTETVLVMIKWDHDGVDEPSWFAKHVGDQWFFRGC